jgi:hypothetical protein
MTSNSRTNQELAWIGECRTETQAARRNYSRHLRRAVAAGGDIQNLHAVA